MKSLFRFLITILFIINTVTSAHGYNCGNNGGSGSTGCSSCTSCNKTGDPFEPYTGNEYRKIRDLEVWGGIGEMPLVWMRYAYSRYGSFVHNFGLAHNWNSSFNYNMADAGLNMQGQPQLYIHYAEGGYNYFTLDTHNPNLWLTLPGVTKRLFQEGNNFYLQMANGYRYRFEKLTDKSGAVYYQLQDIRDSKQNLYKLSYNADKRLVKVTEPAGRYLTIDYRTINNGVLYPLTVINKVSTSDGRSVNYHYSIIKDALSGYAWVSLDTVYYGDGTKAVYIYSQSEPGLELNLEHAIDPRYEGTDVNIRFTYDNNNTWGFIKEEKNGVTGEVMATLNSEAGRRTVCYANGRVQVFDAPEELIGKNRSYTDGLGRKTFFTYERGNGFLETETDALGRVTTYNKLTVYGNPLEGTYPDGSKESWTRDDLDQILTHTDELGRVTTYNRDARHRVTRIDYPDGTKERFTYNNFGEVLTHIRRNGGIETKAYDNRGLNTHFIDAEGNLTQYTYDSADRLASITDALGNITRSEYNERGLLTRSINADGSNRTFGYDDFGNQTTLTNELSHTWITHYDEFKRRDSLMDPLRRLTVYKYDLPGGVCGCSHDNGNPTTIILPSGRLTRFEYDVEWEKISETVGAGTADAATTFYEYDLVGNLIIIVDPRGKSWSTEYDVRDRKKSSVDPLDNKTLWTYDKAGNILTIARPDTGTTINYYDEMNRVTQTADPKGQVTRMKYDEEGNMVKLTDANNHNYNFEYDLLDRKTRMSYPGGTFERFTFDRVGNLVTYTNRSGDIRTYTYDYRNHETNSVWSDNTPDISRSYDTAGRLLSLSSTVSLLSYTYDNANQLISETQNVAGSHGARTVKYMYNADGLKSAVTYPDGNILYYSYTGRNQLAVIIEGAIPGVTYTYDLNGNRIKKALLNGTSTVYNYDDANRVLLVDNQKSGVSFARFDYGYDKVNRRKFVKKDNGKGDVYAYDATDQVTDVHYEVTNPEGLASNPNRTVNYDWDAVGNRINVNDNGTVSNYTTNNRNEYTTVNGSSLTYNANGDLRTFNGWNYMYDAQDRLIKAKKGSEILDFDYDTRNRCVKRTINGINTFLYYNEWNLIEEDNMSGSHTDYVHGSQVDEIINRITTGVFASLYYHYDALGNVTDLTDASGNVVEKYFYDVFGNVIIKNTNGDIVSVSAFGNRFMFTGREYVQEINLYDYRNRIYSPMLGRFMQIDPKRFNAKDINILRYVKNNPANMVDPMGLVSCDKKEDIGNIWILEWTSEDGEEFIRWKCCVCLKDNSVSWAPENMFRGTLDNVLYWLQRTCKGK